jgi:tetratricopeptide (TPR) repeat protein
MAWLFIRWGKPADRMVGWALLNLSFALMFQWLTIAPHELGHALASRALGMRVHKIVLGIGPLLFGATWLGAGVELHAYPVVGWTVFTDPRENGYRGRKFLSVAGGPLANILLLAATIGFLPRPNPFQGVLTAWKPLAAFAVANGLTLFWSLLPWRTSWFDAGSDGLQLLRLPFLGPAELRSQRALHFLLEGVEALARKKLDLALQWNQKGLRLFPESLPLRNNLAVTQARLGLYELAREEFKTVVAAPAVETNIQALAQSNVAFSDLMLDRPELLEEADRMTSDAMRHLAWLPIVRGTRGAVLVSSGKLDEGIALLKEAFERQGDPGQKAIDACFLALGLQAQGRAEEGIPYLESAERLSPGGIMLPRARKAYGRNPYPENPISAQ